MPYTVVLGMRMGSGNRKSAAFVIDKRGGRLRGDGILASAFARYGIIRSNTNTNTNTKVLIPSTNTNMKC